MPGGTSAELQDEKARRFAEIYVFETPGNSTAAYMKMASEFDIQVEKENAQKNMSRYFRTEPVKKWLAYYREEARSVYQINKEEIVANLKNIAFDSGESKRTRLDAMKSLIDMGGYKTENHNIDSTQTINVSLVD